MKDWWERQRRAFDIGERDGRLRIMGTLLLVGCILGYVTGRGESDAERALGIGLAYVMLELADQIHPRK